jgi:hypothetical protein
MRGSRAGRLGVPPGIARHLAAQAGAHCALALTQRISTVQMEQPQYRWGRPKSFGCRHPPAAASAASAEQAQLPAPPHPTPHPPPHTPPPPPLRTCGPAPFQDLLALAAADGMCQGVTWRVTRSSAASLPVPQPFPLLGELRRRRRARVGRGPVHGVCVVCKAGRAGGRAALTTFFTRRIAATSSGCVVRQSSGP